ncbi:MAG: Holliday junction resolvase RuvX [Sedimentisphaerales bacterium]|nr:Holliday junction resolvase RuvX [Sedimentisphaerales bacterium]
MRYLAIDYGLKRTGLAVCDASETICSPLAVLDKPQKLLEQILETIKAEQIEAVVIGLPLNMDGSEGGQSELVRKFAEKLKERVDIPIHFQDERLSSFAAEKKLSDIEMSRAEKKKRIDAIAAADLLETFLEKKEKGE